MSSNGDSVFTHKLPVFRNRLMFFLTVYMYSDILHGQLPGCFTRPTVQKHHHLDVSAKKNAPFFEKCIFEVKTTKIFLRIAFFYLVGLRRFKKFKRFIIQNGGCILCEHDYNNPVENRNAAMPHG